MTTLFGITSCDTVKKTRRWLDEHGIDYEFHDFRTDGITQAQLQAWCDRLGHETLLNKRGTTWRRLPGDVKASIDKAKAIQVMQENPAVIKRPVLDVDGRLFVGFSDNSYRDIFL